MGGDCKRRRARDLHNRATAVGEDKRLAERFAPEDRGSPRHSGWAPLQRTSRGPKAFSARHRRRTPMVRLNTRWKTGAQQVTPCAWTLLRLAPGKAIQRTAAMMRTTSPTVKTRWLDLAHFFRTGLDIAVLLPEGELLPITFSARSSPTFHFSDSGHS